MRRGGGGPGGPVSVWPTQHLTLVVIVIISQFVSQIWLERHGESMRERRECQVTRLSHKGGRLKSPITPEQLRTDRPAHYFYMKLLMV